MRSIVKIRLVPDYPGINLIFFQKVFGSMFTVSFYSDFQAYQTFLATSCSN